MERGKRSYWCFLTVLFCHYYSWLLCQYSISLNGISLELLAVWFLFVLQWCFLGFNSSMGRHWSIKEWRDKKQKGQRRKCSLNQISPLWSLAAFSLGHVNMACVIGWDKVEWIYAVVGWSRWGWPVDLFLSTVDLTLISAFNSRTTHCPFTDFLLHSAHRNGTCWVKSPAVI